jgi:hypothetical protein
MNRTCDESCVSGRVTTMVAGRIALWDQASLTESNKLHRLPSKLLSYSQFHPSPPKQFSAVYIMSIDGQTPLELVDRVIADNTPMVARRLPSGYRSPYRRASVSIRRTALRKPSKPHLRAVHYAAKWRSPGAGNYWTTSDSPIQRLELSIYTVSAWIYLILT